MTIGDPRYRSGDPASYSRPRPTDLPGVTRRATGALGRGPSMDMGTVAVGITGMSFYWLMPALMSGRSRRRRSRRSQG